MLVQHQLGIHTRTEMAVPIQTMMATVILGVMIQDAHQLIQMGPMHILKMQLSGVILMMIISGTTPGPLQIQIGVLLNGVIAPAE